MTVPTWVTLGALAVTLLAGRRWRRPEVWPVAAGFLFSLAGDYFLRNRGAGGDVFFLGGIGMFLLAHLAFLRFALRHGRLNRRWLAAGLAAYGAYFAVVLSPAMPGPVLAAAALAYTVVSVFGLAAAAGIRGSRAARIAYAAGIGLILFSDTVISWKEFLGIHRWDWLILPTYEAAHVALAAAVVLLLRPRRQTEGQG
jgi:uncharacterized membrane protein YhhN